MCLTLRVYYHFVLKTIFRGEIKQEKGPPFNNYIKKASALINNTGEVENRAF